MVPKDNFKSWTTPTTHWYPYYRVTTILYDIYNHYRSMTSWWGQHSNHLRRLVLYLGMFYINWGVYRFCVNHWCFTLWFINYCMKYHIFYFFILFYNFSVHIKCKAIEDGWLYSNIYCMHCVTTTQQSLDLLS